LNHIQQKFYLEVSGGGRLTGAYPLPLPGRAGYPLGFAMHL